MSVSLSEEEHNDHATMARRLFPLANDPAAEEPQTGSKHADDVFPGRGQECACGHTVQGNIRARVFNSFSRSEARELTYGRIESTVSSYTVSVVSVEIWLRDE
jgi:hypothetical protein